MASECMTSSSPRVSRCSYAAKDGAGRLLTSSPMPTSISAYGHLGLIPRSDLLAILRPTLDAIEIRDGVGLEGLTQAPDHVNVRFDDGSLETFDMVVGTDGSHSRVRELLFGRIPDRDTGWGCYVWCAAPHLAADGVTTEHWGAGSFLGTYPCRERVCVIAGAPVDVLKPNQVHGRSGRLAALLGPYGVPVEDFLTDLPGDDETLFLWPMTDVRSLRWVRGRVALVGDAAASFLPTAGIGASMALESAAVLADELSLHEPTTSPTRSSSTSGEGVTGSKLHRPSRVASPG